MSAIEVEHFKDEFMRLIGQIDSLDLLQWSHDELEGQISRLNYDMAGRISNGDLVEVTRGPGQGMRGTVVGRHPEDAGVMLVELDGVDVGSPIPIPALALSILAAH